MTPTSRLSGFRALSPRERVELLGRVAHLSPQELALLTEGPSLSISTADQMVENVVGTFSLPLAVGLNLQVNGRDYLVPMAVEEPSVVAALSLAAKLVRQANGFRAEADASTMIGQVQVTRYGDPAAATERILTGKEQLLALANSFHPHLVRRGGGAKDLEVRVLPAPEGPAGEPLLVVHLLIDTQEAMGANLVNTMAEGVAPLIEQLTGGRVYLRILSNLADRRLARASCRLPLELLADGDLRGEEIAEGIAQASRFAQADPYRAATHNKGVMNGVDALALALGQDWRAIEAGAHAYACRTGQYRPLSTWALEDRHLVGRLELPLALGTVGGVQRAHPGVQLSHKLLGVGSAREMATVFASVGLAQNLAALRALGSVGIQRGHMALHARCVRGARGPRHPPTLEEAVRQRDLPRHVGIIMDGNGRWAQRQRLPRLEGHREGSKRVREVTRAARRLGLGALTLYAFSEENWGRPSLEVAGLMSLLREFLLSERQELLRNNIRLHAVGALERLPALVREPLHRLREDSAKNDGLVLTLALSYGSRQELLSAVQHLIEKRTAFGPRAGKVTEADLEANLWTCGLPELDLVIRTSGEKRLSNFLLWQAAYAELSFVNSLWPDFGEEDLFRCLADYQGRQRRFGKVPARRPSGTPNTAPEVQAHR